MPRRAPPPGGGEDIGGEALDAAGLLATNLDGYRRRAPEGPFPDLASFADPPAAPARRDRADLDAALAALDAADAELDGDELHEERTSFDRPGSHSGKSGVAPAPERPPLPDEPDDDLDLEIEISLDDD
ncbi:MAG: hypothetical protein H6708_32855 [Kofleriaceae bacterium]|nr:hypothetical protein [Kofleriaceae bacterium]